MNRITTRDRTSLFQQKSVSKSLADKAKKWVIVFALIIGQVLATSTQAAGERVIVNDRLPFTALVFDQCTGEMVRFAGIFHQVIKTWTDKNGTVYWKRDINAHGEGQGLSSGNSYIWNDTFEQELINPQGCAFTITNPDRYLRLISKGPSPNRLLKVVNIFGRDENCQLFSSLELEIRCVG